MLPVILFGLFGLLVLVPASLLCYAVNLDDRIHRAKAQNASQNATTPFSAEEDSGPAVGFHKLAFGFFALGIAGVCVTLCVCALAFRAWHLAFRFRNAAVEEANLQSEVEAALPDRQLQETTLQRAVSSDTDGIMLGHPQARERGTYPRLGRHDESSSYYYEVHSMCVCGLSWICICFCGWLVSAKLEGSSSWMGLEGITWVWAMSPLWLFLPSVLLLALAIQLCTFACCCARTACVQTALQDVWPQLLAVACFVGFGVWLALPFFQQMDHPTGETPTPGSSFSVALGLLLFGVACCACILNPGALHAAVISEGHRFSITERAVEIVLGFAAWFCCGACFVSSIVIGVYLTAMKITGHQASFLPDASYGFDVGLFIFGIPCLMCLCGPVGLILFWCFNGCPMSYSD
jgi:hypothetical protein